MSVRNAVTLFTDWLDWTNVLLLLCVVAFFAVIVVLRDTVRPHRH